MTEHDVEIRRLWHDQPGGDSGISIEAVRRKSRQLEHKVRLQNVFTAALFGVVIAVEAWQIWRQPELLERVGDLLTIAAFIAAAWQFRGAVGVDAMAAGLGRTASVDFYRSQLARRRDLDSHPWRYLVLFVPRVTLSLFGRVVDRPLADNVAIAMLGVALFLGVAWVHRRSARRLQHEIDSFEGGFYGDST